MGKAAVSSFGTRVGQTGRLSRALDPVRENIYALESLKGYIVSARQEARTEISDNVANVGTDLR